MAEAVKNGKNRHSGSAEKGKRQMATVLLDCFFLPFAPAVGRVAFSSILAVQIWIWSSCSFQKVAPNNDLWMAAEEGAPVAEAVSL